MSRASVSRVGPCVRTALLPLSMPRFAGGPRCPQRGFRRLPALGLGLAVAFACGLVSASAATIPLGVVFTGEKAGGTVPLVNAGSQEVFFVEAVSDCPCLTVQAESAVVPAGQSRALPYTYLSKDTGRFAVQVKLQGAEPGAVLATHRLTGFVAERSWLIRAAELATDKARSDQVVVDLRAPHLFAQARLPRSVNQEAFALKTRTQWKNRPIVLVDEGCAPADLLAEVAALRAAGFREVRALEGGLAAWVRNGGVLEGVAVSAAEVAQILPAQFARSSRSNEWRVIDLATAGDDAGAELMRLPVVPPGRLPPRVLVVGDESAYARIEGRCGASNVSRLFYLRGGPVALAEFYTRQVAMAAGPGVGVAVSQAGGDLPHVAGCVPCGK